MLLLLTTVAQYHEQYKEKRISSVRFAAILYLCYQLYDMLNVICYAWLVSRRQALELSHIKKKLIDKPTTQTCNCFTTFICTLDNLNKKIGKYAYLIFGQKIFEKER